MQLGINDFDCPAPLTNYEFKPGLVKIPLVMHIGRPGVPIVEVGQSIEKGALIACAPDNALGANIHASISGTVVEIAEHIAIACGERGEKL